MAACRDRKRSGGSQKLVEGRSEASRANERTAMADNNETETRTVDTQAEPQAKNRQLFIAAMREPLHRTIAFDVVDRNCRRRFPRGADGVRLYLSLLSDVRSANVPEAVEEFRRRFESMCDQDLMQEWREVMER
jgi:hypothetical protein